MSSTFISFVSGELPFAGERRPIRNAQGEPPNKTKKEKEISVFKNDVSDRYICILHQYTPVPMYVDCGYTILLLEKIDGKRRHDDATLSSLASIYIGLDHF